MWQPFRISASPVVSQQKPALWWHLAALYLVETARSRPLRLDLRTPSATGRSARWLLPGWGLSNRRLISTSIPALMPRCQPQSSRTVPVLGIAHTGTIASRQSMHTAIFANIQLVESSRLAQDVRTLSDSIPSMRRRVLEATQLTTP